MDGTRCPVVSQAVDGNDRPHRANRVALREMREDRSDENRPGQMGREYPRCAAKSLATHPRNFSAEVPDLDIAAVHVLTSRFDGLLVGFRIYRFERNDAVVLID